jgi:hypothetical protein
MNDRGGGLDVAANDDRRAFEPITLVRPGELDSFRTVQQGIVALTDAWGREPVAAVLRGGSNAEAALEFLSRSGVSKLDIYHLEERLPQLEEVFLSSVVNRAHELFSEVRVHWRHDANVMELVEAIGAEYGALVFGAPLAHSEIMPLFETVRSHYSGGLAIVRGPLGNLEFSESDEIYKWVRQRTFESSDFSLPAVLHGWKTRRNLRVAVMLPSLNEAKTVGHVIATALEVKEIGLVDEVILIDSDSTDSTVDIAQSYGIPVYRHREIRPELGSYRGKGEAMFKSAFVSESDVLLWVDTDISSITPRFFYGLLGPILTCPEVRFVKGYFSRPVSVEPSGLELGGGRVTEIMMRPWISTFMPHLSGFIQPLAGTVAISRPLLSQMRIPTNYGVEIAMLMQAVNLAGLAATAQVNLGEVIHKSKDTEQLGEMSFQIFQVLSQLALDGTPAAASDVLRRVFSAGGRFQIGIKRYSTYWRGYEQSALVQATEQ